MTRYICSLTLDFDAEDEDEARALFFDYLNEVKQVEIEVEADE